MPIVKYYVYQTTQRFQWDNYSNSKSTVDIIFEVSSFKETFRMLDSLTANAGFGCHSLVSVLENNEESINSPSLMENNRVISTAGYGSYIELVNGGKTCNLVAEWFSFDGSPHQTYSHSNQTCYGIFYLTSWF